MAREHDGRLATLTAHFTSDTHAFHPLNGALKKQLRMIFASSAEIFHCDGDTVDFQNIEWVLGRNGYERGSLPTKIETALALLPEAETHLRFIDVLVWRGLEGQRVTVEGGNHDPGFDLLDGQRIQGVVCKKEDIFDAGPWGRFLVAHGHRFDPAFLQSYNGLYGLGGRILNRGLAIDYKMSEVFPSLREAFPVSNTLKALGKQYIKSFRREAVNRAVEMQLDGIICGHIHRLDDRKIKIHKGATEKRRYINLGDGLTHGTSVGFNVQDGFMTIRAKHIPEDAADILGKKNPLKKIRPHTMTFLQVAWEAHLQTLVQNKPEIEHAGDLIPTPTAA